MRLAARFAVFLKFYQVVLFVVAKPKAFLLDWWLGPETIAFFRERDFRILSRSIWKRLIQTWKKLKQSGR
jgi:metal transporter CNNM